MAEPRRRAGFLREEILRLLQDQPRPVGALRLIRMVSGDGRPVPSSLVFRAIRQLVELGAIRKILVGGGYALAGGDRMITLSCRQCGGLTDIVGSDMLDELHRMAAAAGFTVSRCLIEVPGLCRHCIETSADLARRCGPLSTDENMLD